MSTPSEIEMVKSVYEGINQNDVATALKYCDEEIVRVEPEGFPMSGTYSGLVKMVEHFSSARATWAEGSCTPERFSVHGDKVVAFVHVHVRLKDSSEWVDAHIADVFTIRHGKIVEMRTFADSKKASDWAQL